MCGGTHYQPRTAKEAIRDIVVEIDVKDASLASALENIEKGLYQLDDAIEWSNDDETTLFTFSQDETFNVAMGKMLFGYAQLRELVKRDKKVARSCKKGCKPKCGK